MKRAYFGLGSRTDVNHSLEFCPKVFQAIFVISEPFKDAAKKATDVNGDQHNGDILSLFSASKNGLGDVSESDLFLSWSCKIQAFCSKCLCLSKEDEEFSNVCPTNIEEGEEK